MDPDRWRLIQDIFLEAVELEGDVRQRFLEETCGDDYLLRSEVDSLISAEAKPPGILRASVSHLAALTESTADAVEIGARVGSYLVEAEIGRGGMGVVYRALDENLQRHVALKFLPDSLARDEDIAGDLLSEARAVSALDHPNVAT
ncbi:MAG: hypothetical protein R3178_03670, partial [Rhodothermales bacterium]|nr:hypothetical protein [Rhodothermales bacterium]